jgi:hypothetical protein
MNDPFHDAVAALCEEVGQDAPSPKAGGGYEVVVDGTTVRAFPLSSGRVVMSAGIGKVVEVAEARRESVQDLLCGCLTLSGARFRKLGIRETMTIEQNSDELVLWRKFEGSSPSISEFLQAAESLLNEVRFWKRWLLSI